MKVRPTNDVVRGLLWWIPGCFIFFREFFTSGFDKIIGTDGDARLQVFLLEHWVQVAQGDGSWTSPQVFFPTKGVLGYGDALLLDEVFYLPLRAVGLDPYLAFQWTLILLSAVGFVALFVFLRRLFDLGPATCAALATTFAFANNLAVKSVHTQLYSIYWVPVVLLLIVQAIQARNPKARLAWGWATGALVGLLFFTSFYIAWYATFVALVIGVQLLIWRLRTRGFTTVRETVRPHFADGVERGLRLRIGVDSVCDHVRTNRPIVPGPAVRRSDELRRVALRRHQRWFVELHVGIRAAQRPH